MLADSDIEEFNSPQGRILYVLWQEDGVPIAALARKTGLAKNTLTAMLARMEAAGLIFRQGTQIDRRQVLVSLTEKARGLEDQYKQVSQRMNELFYQGMTQEDASLLDGLLDRVLKNLEGCEKALRRSNQTNSRKEAGHDGKN